MSTSSSYSFAPYFRISLSAATNPFKLPIGQHSDSDDFSMIFQEDNDSSHGTQSFENIARYAKTAMDLNFIENWPPNSPDLNAIENLWRTFRSRVELHHAMSPKQLMQAIKTEWKMLKQWEIDECILGGDRAPEGTQRRHKVKTCPIKSRIPSYISRNGLSMEFEP